MTSLPVAVQRLVSADPRDPGCGETTELLHVYADLAAADPRAAVQDYPGATAHLRDCAPCAEDLTGLLAAISADAPGALAPAERRRAAGASCLCAAPGPGHHP